ncbi:unnamed protein product [Camellia sinensis]
MKNRYIHFPINHDNHWTIVVFDNADGIWRHYDSLRPAKDCHNKHIEIAKEIVKNDCAIVVCNIINQYINWQPVQQSLRSTEWVKFRAEIVSQFLNDEIRSWKLEHYQMLTKHTKP